MHKIYIKEKKTKEEHVFEYYDYDTLKDSLEVAFNDAEMEVMFSVDENEVSLEEYVFLINLNPFQTNINITDANVKTAQDLTEWIEQARILNDISKLAFK